MGRRKRRGSKGKNSSVDDMLNGRVHPSVRELIEAIHTVNPTGQLSERREKADRYHVKSRLQSMLIDRFGADLDFQRDTRDEKVVLILHRTLGMDGCHAVLDELDIAARSTVRRALDLQEAAAKTTEAETRSILPVGIELSRAETQAASVEGAPEELCRLGEDALESYDYDKAQAYFEAAWKKRPDDPEIAVRFLDFLVNYFGAYESGLTIATDPMVPKTEEIRTLASLAAVRLGRYGEAADLAEKLSAPSLCEVWLKNADQAILAKQWERAESYVARAQALSPRDAAIIPRAEAIRAGRAKARMPDEAACEKLLRDGRLDEAAEAAVALKEQWPNSRVSGRVLLEVEKRKRAQALRCALDNAERARADGALERAVREYRNAIELGGGADDISPKITALLNELKTQADRKIVEKIRARRRNGGTEAVLLDYLDLTAALKARVRRDIGDETFSLADRLIAGDASKRQRQHTARAIAALLKAEHDMASDDIDAAYQAVRPYRQLLHSLGRYEAIDEAYVAVEARRRKQRSIEALNAFERAVVENRHSDIESLRGRISLKDLDDTDSARYADIEETLTQARRENLIKNALDDATSRNDLFSMRYLLGRLATTAKPKEAAELRERQRDLSVEIQKKWRVSMLDGKDAAGVDLGALKRIQSAHIERIWLSPDGETVGLAWGVGRWIFGQVTDVETGRPRQVLAGRSDVRFTSSADTTFDGRIMTLCDGGGALIRFDVETGDVVDRFDYRALVSGPDLGEFGLFIPDKDLLFAHTCHQKTAKLGMKVIALREMEMERDLGEQGWSSRILPLKNPLIATLKEDRICCLYNKRAYPQTRFRLDDAAGLYQVAVHPDGERLVFCATLKADHDSEREGTLYLVSTDLNGAPGPFFRIDGSDFESVCDLGVSKVHNLVFVRWEKDDRQIHLTAFAAKDDGFEKQFDVIIPRSVALLQDPSAHRAALMGRTPAGGAIEILGPTPPKVTDWKADLDGIASIDRRFLNCAWPDDGMREASQGIWSWMQGLRPKEHQKRLSDYMNSRGDDVPGILAIGHASCLTIRTSYREALEPFTQSLRDKPNMTSELNLMRAHYYSRQSDLTDISPYLEQIAPERLAPENRAHYYHLMGVAAYHNNDLNEARRCFSEMAAQDKTCTDANLLLAIVGPPDTSVEGLPEKYRNSAALIRLIEKADEAIAEKRWKDGARYLDTELVWRAEEQQSQARLCYLLMRIPEQSAVEAFRTKALLATFIDSEARYNRIFRTVLMLGAAHWDVDRIQSVVKDAEEWLAS